MQRLLGHAMVVSVLNRSGMAIFRAAYDYAGAGYPDGVALCEAGVLEFSWSTSLDGWGHA